MVLHQLKATQWMPEMSLCISRFQRQQVKKKSLKLKLACKTKYSHIENFDKAFEEREFSRAYTYIFDMLSHVTTKGDENKLHTL